MKTNFTMKTYFLAAFVMMAFVVSSCEDDEPTPEPVDISGKYTLNPQSAGKLVDGNVSATSPNADPLVILNGGGAGVDLEIPVGDVTTTSFFVNEVLKGAAPCEAVDTRTWAYQIDLQKEGNKTEFICTSENNTTTTDLGTWSLSDDTKTMIITIASVALGGEVTVKVDDVIIGTDGSIEGNIGVLPMIIDAAAPIGLSNVQFISVDVKLDKVQ